MKILQRLATPLLVVAFGLLLLVGAGRTSAAKPPLGEGRFAPGPLIPWYPSSIVATTILFIAYVAAAVAVLLRLWTRPVNSTRWWIVGGLAVAALLTGPFGSADHINYAAYGRIAVGGGDPYTQSPLAWHHGQDPVTSAVQVPWRETPSIYGPLATALQAVASWIGGSSLRDTVWIWQIFMVAAWLGVRWLLRRLTDDAEAHARIDVLWTLNPLVFGVLLLGAHVDLLAAAFVIAALWAMRENPWATGIFVGAAFCTKVTYGIVLLAVLWAWRQHPPADFSRRLRALAIGFALLVIPAYALAGPNVFHQLGAAGGSFSYASPWSPVIRGLRHLVQEWTVTTIVFALAALLMLLFAWGAHRLIGRLDLAQTVADPAQREAIVLTGVLMTVYALLAPYSLPWYDAVTWALLPLLVGFVWDEILVGRMLFMTLAYAPGRAFGINPGVEDWTLGFRSNVTPYVNWAALLAMLLAGWRVARSPRSLR
ncbi:glycosyltransferase 87 family protein [Calidifontibacter terrae]